MALSWEGLLLFLEAIKDPPSFHFQPLTPRNDQSGKVGEIQPRTNQQGRTFVTSCVTKTFFLLHWVCGIDSYDSFLSCKQRLQHHLW